MRRFRMFVKRGFQFSEPTTNLDVPVPAHDALVLKYQNSVFGDVFSYLFDNCKANTVKSYRRTRLMLKSRFAPTALNITLLQNFTLYTLPSGLFSVFKSTPRTSHPSVLTIFSIFDVTFLNIDNKAPDRLLMLHSADSGRFEETCNTSSEALFRLPATTNKYKNNNERLITSYFLILVASAIKDKTVGLR